MAKREFVKTAQASEALGRSRQWLITRIKSGTFKKGIHYRNVSDGMRPTYEFCLTEIEKIYG